ncbi:hypothetical protein BH11ACT8_BH11ACT8_19180 [soil metagenome]
MSGRSGRSGASLISTLAVLVVVGLVLLVGSWAATSGPDEVFQGSGPTPSRVQTTAVTSSAPTEEPSNPPPPPERRAPPDSHIGDVLAVIVQVVFVMLVLVGAGLLLTWLWQQRPRKRHRRGEAEAVDFDVLDPVAAAEAMARDAEEQVALLRQGAPRNAIVACWQRFEIQAESAGVPRHSWETPTDFTDRLFRLVEADRRAVDRLAALYRQARFSDHEVTEADREAALEALGRIHDGLHVHSQDDS